MSFYSPTMTIMVQAARNAARSLNRDFNEVEHLQVSVKSASDFVSAADVRAEEIIRETLMEGRPAYGMLCEESGWTKGKDPTRRWIVDPLDGTTNFLHGLPHFAISIAYEQRGEIVSGLVYDPIKDELFWAEKGQGAWVNNRRLRVSARRDMAESIFATGIPWAGRSTLPATLKEIGRIAPACAGIRRFGSAALDLAYVAAGRYEGFWERGLKEWDIASGILLVREAGGFVTDIRGEDDMLARGSIIATNADMLEPFSKLLDTQLS